MDMKFSEGYVEIRLMELTHQNVIKKKKLPFLQSFTTDFKQKSFSDKDTAWNKQDLVCGYYKDETVLFRLRVTKFSSCCTIILLAQSVQLLFQQKLISKSSGVKINIQFSIGLIYQ